MQKVLHFIHGKKTAPVQDRYLENVNPATGQVFSFLARGSKEDVHAAVQSARNAFTSWSKISRKERCEYLFKIADLIAKRKKEFAQAESQDQGKPVLLAEQMDIERAALNFRYFAGILLHNETSAAVSDGAFSFVLRKPIGVAGLISPWNLPLYLLTWKIAPALACGNTVVCKPSELTSMTADLLADVCNEAGLPPGVVNIVYGLGSEVGEPLVVHNDVNIISFTGGTATGQRISSLASSGFKRVSLELGGKNPNLIFADCDLTEAVNTSIRSSFLNQGEICLCGSRIYVQDKIYDQFVGEFVAKAKALRVGDPADKQNFMGAIVSAVHLEKIKSYIEIAKQEGAEILCGGSAPQDLPAEFKNGFWFLPTVIAGLSQNSRCVQEEIFGPVVTVQKFSTVDEAIALANDGRYGLSASVWTKDIQTSQRCARELNVGTVWINTWLHRDLRMPFGGAKQSGLGREGGAHSLDFFSELTTVCTRT